MELIIFLITAILAIGSALLVILGKRPVNSVLFLVLTFFCIAVAYVLLGAQFLAAMQVIVYAGAIMVLFMFVVMLLNLRDPQSWETMPLTRYVLGFGAAGGVLLVAIMALKTAFNANAALDPRMGTVEAVGEVLFQKYLLPFELASVLLLTAIIGVVMMVKRQQLIDEKKIKSAGGL